MDRSSVEQQIAALRSEILGAIDAARRELLAELRAIREALPRRAPSDVAKLAALLEQLAVGVELTSKRLYQAAEDRKNESFRRAVVAITREAPKKLAIRRIGDFLVRNAGHASAGKCIEALDRAGDGNHYRVVQVLESNTWATLGRPAYRADERKPTP